MLPCSVNGVQITVQTHSKCCSCIFLGSVKDGVLTIGTVSTPVYNPNEKIKVPDVLFYDNPQVNTHADHIKVQYNTCNSKPFYFNG